MFLSPFGTIFQVLEPIWDCLPEICVLHMMLTTHIHIELKWRISGGVPPLTCTPSRRSAWSLGTVLTVTLAVVELRSVAVHLYRICGCWSCRPYTRLIAQMQNILTAFLCSQTAELRLSSAVIWPCNFVSDYQCFVTICRVCIQCDYPPTHHITLRHETITSPRRIPAMS
jgi:hypothetical protein